MAHKLKIKRVPYVRKDGTVSPTKKKYVVRCKARHKVCLETEPFATRTEAEKIAAKHWDALKTYRQEPSTFRAVKKSFDTQPSSGVYMLASVAA